MAKFATFFQGRLSGLEITCIQSFIDNGHDITVYAYDDCGAPGHIKVMDAAAIISRDKIFYYKNGPGKGSISAFSNLFRYTLLSQVSGTWWIDTDVICLTSDWPDERTIGAAWEGQERVNGAVLYCAQKAAIDLALLTSAMGPDVQWGQAGPELLTAYAREKELTNAILPTCAFYPIPYENWAMPFLANCLTETQVKCLPAYTLHLWNEMGRRCGFDKSVIPDPHSFIGRLVRKHGTEQYFGQPTKKECDTDHSGSLPSEVLLKQFAREITLNIQTLELKLNTALAASSRPRRLLPHRIAKWRGTDQSEI